MVHLSCDLVIKKHKTVFRLRYFTGNERLNYPSNIPLESGVLRGALGLKPL